MGSCFQTKRQLKPRNRKCFELKDKINVEAFRWSSAWRRTDWKNFKENTAWSDLQRFSQLQELTPFIKFSPYAYGNADEIDNENN